MPDRRYPLADLVAVSGLSEAALGRRVGLSGTTLVKARQLGLVERAADRYAVRVGLHPWEVWPEMEAHAIAELVEAEAAVLERARAAGRRHKAKRMQDPAYRAQRAEYLRQYRSSERAKEVARRYRRNYYQANRARELERQRNYDATVRTVRRAGKKGDVEIAVTGYTDINKQQMTAATPSAGGHPGHQIVASGPENSQVASGTVDGVDDKENAA